MRSSMKAMRDRPKHRPLLVWNLVLTILLVALLAGGVGRPSASSPIQIASAASTAPVNVGGDYTSTTLDDTISTGTPDVLVQVSTNLLNHTHYCLVTASAQANYDTNGEFTFGLNVDTTASQAAGSANNIELTDNAGIDDDSYEEVSSTYGFTVTAGLHTFYWSALALAGSTVVDNSSMTVACFQVRA
jgi:hypothetical protein